MNQVVPLGEYDDVPGLFRAEDAPLHHEIHQKPDSSQARDIFYVDLESILETSAYPLAIDAVTETKTMLESVRKITRAAIIAARRPREVLMNWDEALHAAKALWLGSKGHGLR